MQVEGTCGRYLPPSNHSVIVPAVLQLHPNLLRVGWRDDTWSPAAEGALEGPLEPLK